jgi:hypothetical protein
LPAGSSHLQTKLQSFGQRAVVLESGETLQAKGKLVATDRPEACHLSGYTRKMSCRSVPVLHLGAKKPPLDEPIWVIDVGSRGPVSNLCVPNVADPASAHEADWLVSASVVGWPTSADIILANMVRGQLRL